MNEIIKTYPWQELPLWVPMAGISYCDGSYRIVRELSPVTVIEYVVKGEGYITVAGKPVPVTADHVYILPKGEPHDYYSSAEEPWEKIFINVYGDLPLVLLEQYGLRGRYVYDGTGMKELFLQVADIARRQPRVAGEDTRLEALFFEALTRLAKADTSGSRNAEAVRLKEYLDTHPERLVGNRELAGVIYRSPDYCVKLFRREYGTTPYDYQIEEKLRVARRLLRDTGLPVSEVAARVGYHDPGYFSGLFHRKCGVSPREYRQRNT